MEFKENLSTGDDIFNHLSACDKKFYQALSSRVDIHEYSQKLAEKAFRHEVWQAKALIGLVAVYYNHDQNGFDFITDVSVVMEVVGQGIASRLLEKSISKSKAGGSAELRLEVDADNAPALKLYNKMGFSVNSEASDGLMLSLSLRHKP